jgi:hypothetical protein
MRITPKGLVNSGFYQKQADGRFKAPACKISSVSDYKQVLTAQKKNLNKCEFFAPAWA